MLALGSDGTGLARFRKLRCRRGQRAGELQVRAAVELGEPLEAQLGDPRRLELAAAGLDRNLDPVHQRFDVLGRHRALVRRPQQRGAQLGAVEALAPAIALADEDGLPLAALVGGEPVAAGGAAAPPADGGPVLDPTGLQGAGRPVAAGTIHVPAFYAI